MTSSRVSGTGGSNTGKALIAGVVIGLLLLAGGNYWKQYKIKRAETA